MLTAYQWFIAGIIAVALTGIAIGRIPGLRMNRATISLVGAVALIAAGAINRHDAYAAIDFDTIALLFAMMVINVNLHLCGFFKLIAVKVVSFAKTPRQLLTLTVISSALLSALFLNDTICIVFTPLMLEIALTLRRNPLPYLMAVATASNAGSVATIIGNPQNMIIGMHSGIPFLDFAGYMIPVAVGSVGIIIVVILAVYRGEFTAEQFVIPEKQEVKIYRPLFIKSSIASALLLVLCIVNVPVSVAALCAASVLLVTRRLKPQRVFVELDWSLLVFFSGLFVITGAMEKSGLSAFVFHLTEPLTSGGIAPLAFTGVILSNLVSNVPAVMLFVPVVPQLQNPQMVWLTLAMATTLAGNLTLLGSVANLIVAESAKRRGITLGFAEYLKSGFIIALLTTIWGVVWLGWIL